jgi:hypothetical protein
LSGSSVGSWFSSASSARRSSDGLLRVALTYAAVWVIALAAWQAGRPELIRSPRLVLAHVWEAMET